MSPSYKLDVYDASTDAVAFFNSGNANGSHIRFGASGTVKNFVGNSAGFITSGSIDDLGLRAVGSIRFATNGAGTDMILDASGNLMVGSANAGNAGTINVSVGAAGTTAGGLQLWAATNQTHFIQFGDGTTGAQVYAGYLAYAHSTDSLLFGTNGADKMTLTSSGNLGLGVNPSAWDGTLATVPGGKYTIQRLFYYPNTPTLLGVYYGRAEYNSISVAAANIDLENFSEIENTRTNAIFAGYLIVKSGATDLTNTADALIIQSGSFRSTSSGGGSVSITLDDLTDVIISSPIDYQVLTYVDGVTGWENKSVSQLPLVYSFNGLSGAVQGVSSINGNTGAITNVAFTNTAQSFSGLQQFTQGISGSGGVTFYFPSGNTSIRFVSTAARYIEITPGLQNSMVGYGSGGFKFKANSGPLSLAATNVTAIGDVDLENQQTILYVDADSGIITFSFVGGQYTFPNTDGSANYVMKTDGAGALEWSPFVRTVNGYSGGVTFLAGSNITLTPGVPGITIAATSGGGGISRSISNISTDTSAGSAASTDYVYICTAGLTLTLPTAVSNTNRYSVKNNTASVVRIYTTSSQTIDGITFFNLNRQYQAIDLISDNSNWSIF